MKTQPLDQRDPMTGTIPRRDPVRITAGVALVPYGAPMPSAWCHYCDRKATTRDHVVPRKRHGRNYWWNLVPSCQPCNNAKGPGSTTCACEFCERAIDLMNLIKRNQRARGETT